MVISFGLTNAPSAFQRAMHNIFTALHHCCLVYMDDISGFSSSLGEHALHLRQVLILNLFFQRAMHNILTPFNGV
jgi:Reverse transcriptase (RNA-dependent DNA polymerase)